MTLKENFSDVNIPFYQHWSLNDFSHYLTVAGLDSAADLDRIRDYLQNAKHILDVGAGFGRAVLYTLHNVSSKADITALEYSGQMTDFMANEFSGMPNVSVIHDDIFEYKTPKQYDCILLLWATFCNFSPEEQEELLERIDEMLLPGGHVIIDTPSPDHAMVNANRIKSGKRLTGHHQGYPFVGYLPDRNDMMEYLMHTDMWLENVLGYRTPKGVCCCLYLIGKS